MSCFFFQFLRGSGVSMVKTGVFFMFLGFSKVL